MERSGFGLRGLSDTQPPLRSMRSAILRWADAEYLLFVNGQLVGSNRYVPGAALDRYEISKFLQPGQNRLVVELRTPRGTGGFLCDLEINDDPAKRIVSDDRWMIQSRHLPRLRTGGPLLPTVQRAKAWASPPTGRWGWPKIGASRPDLASIMARQKPLSARKVSTGGGRADWQRVRRARKGSASVGSWVTFDWKKNVQGFIRLKLADREFAGALLFVGRRRPDPLRDKPANFVISIPGRRSWTDSQPRSFRYATVVGLSELAGAELLEVEKSRFLEFRVQAAAPRGVYGLQDLDLRTPMENKIWRQLHRLAGARQREEI
jgi:hypothetical protein